MGNVINENKGYESINRDLIFDERLSDRARFVYIYMSAKPEGWDFFIAYMCKELGYSEATLRKYINELIDGGWVIKEEQQKDTNGRFSATKYTIRRQCEKINRDVNFTVPQKIGDGKIIGQRNIDNKEIKDFIRDIDRDTSENDGGVVTTKPQRSAKSKYAETAEAFLNSPITLEAFCKNNQVTPEQCAAVIGEIVTEWEFAQPRYNTATEAKLQLLRTLETKIRIKREHGLLNSKNRKEQFAQECKALKEEGYNKEDVARFYKYYIQSALDGSGKALFETYKAWDTKTRFKMFINPNRHG